MSTEYKVVEKTPKGVVIELERFNNFNWIYFARDGIDIGYEPTYTHGVEQKVRHYIPIPASTKAVRIKIEVVEP